MSECEHTQLTTNVRLNQIFQMLLKDLSDKTKKEIENQKTISELREQVKVLQKREQELKSKLNQYELSLKKFDSENQTFIQNIKSVPLKTSSLRSHRPSSLY